MKIILAVAPLLILATFSCERNEYIVPPPIPTHYYGGSYEVVISNPGAIPQVTSQYINWTFTDQFIFCEIDTIKSVRFICDFGGRFVLSDSMCFLNVTPSGPDCDTIYIPNGWFEFSSARFDNSIDFIILRQNKFEGSYSIVKTITLVKKGS